MRRPRRGSAAHWASFLALIFIVASPGVFASYDLHGRFETRQALEVAPGAVTIDPTLGLRTVALLDEWAGVAAQGQVFLRTEYAQYRLYRYESPAALGPPLVEPKQDPPALVDMAHATLSLDLVRANPQVLLGPPELAGPMSLTLDANATTCRVNQGGPEHAFQHPDDPDRVGTEETRRYEPQFNHLAVECQASNATAHRPAVVRFYGMNLRLHSDTEPDRLLETGTFERPLAGGLTQKVTQILEVVYRKEPLDLDLSFPLRVRFHSESLLAVGAFRAGSSVGNLTWGAWTGSGSLEPWQATGAFRVAWAPGDAYRLDGATATDPPVAGAIGTSTASAGGPTAVVLAGAAGLAILGLFARVLWTQFSRLAPDRLLEHPRRSQILEYVRGEPGVETQTVARSLGLRWPKVAYHVSVLARAGHLTVRRLGGRTALFADGHGWRGREAQMALLRRPSARRVYQQLRKQPGLDQAALAWTLLLGQSQVSRTLRALTRTGLIRGERAGRRLRYYSVAS